MHTMEKINHQPLLQKVMYLVPIQASDIEIQILSPYVIFDLGSEQYIHNVTLEMRKDNIHYDNAKGNGGYAIYIVDGLISQ